MRFLLDTHVYYWWNASPQKLSARIYDLLSEFNQELLISIVTPLELAIKTNNGKMDGAGLLEDFEARESAFGFTIIQPTAAQAIRSGLLPLHHKDPFDRLLAAQALDLRIPLLSRDSIFDRYGVRRIWN